MVADDGAAAQRRKTDVAGAARAGMSVARTHRALIKSDAAPGRSGLAEQERRARRRIDLLVVVHLDDLDVEILIERLGDLLHQRGKQIDADTHVAGLHDDGALGGILELRFVGGAEAGRADDVHDAAFRGQRRKRHASRPER